MTVFLGVSDWLETEGSGEFYCQVCHCVSSFVFVRARRFLYIAFLPTLQYGASWEFIRCMKCKNTFPKSVFDEGSPMVFLTSLVENDGSITYGLRDNEAEMPVDSKWALGCWFDGLWYPVVLGRQRGKRRLALFGDRGYLWLDPEYVAPMDIRIGDMAYIARSIPEIDRENGEEWCHDAARLLTWEPDYRRTVVEFADGVRKVTPRWFVCFKRPIRLPWKSGDRVLAYRNEGFFFPGTVRHVEPSVEIWFDDGAVHQVSSRLVTPLELAPNARVFVRSHGGVEYSEGQVASWQENGVLIRLRSGEPVAISFDRLAVPNESFAPSSEDMQTFFESAPGPMADIDLQSNANQLSQAIQVAGRRQLQHDDAE
jgi:hypothetical protein